MTTAQMVGIIISVVLGGVSGLFAALYKLGRYTQIVDDLKNEVSSLKSEFKELSKDLNTCSTKLEERTSRGADAYTKRKSPISLNEKGEELLKRSGIDKFVLENQSDLVGKIKEKTPKTAYDVQVFSKNIVEAIYTDDKFNPFKDFAFKEGLDIEVIFTVMSLYLRDIALPLLGFSYDQLDKTDPAKVQIKA